MKIPACNLLIYLYVGILLRHLTGLTGSFHCCTATWRPPCAEANTA